MSQLLKNFFEDLIPSVYAEEKEEEVHEEEQTEEPEAEEPEDLAPQIREDCENSSACSPAKHHLEECARRVESGSDENCVEEFFHLMHCVDHCAAPKVFATLK
ncbi:uncharacterized protein VTP21DRAFT_7165 [Calcarisporiella thermophila]|uniref:uncharacterized protein n=1 Tax=Calcarisporiella thermophila TaxID=911321 RepID=UPI0037443295